MANRMVPPPKDGLRAVCPQFRARMERYGVYFLVCKQQGLKFEAREDRDEYYRAFCCGDKLMRMMCETRKA